MWLRWCSGRRVVCCWAGLLGVPVGGGPPASRPRRELRSARRLEARPGPAAAHGHRSLPFHPSGALHTGGAWCADVWFGALARCLAGPRRRPRAPQPGPVGQLGRLSETVVAFACWYLYGVETGVAFAGAKWVFWVRFSVAEVMPVSAVPC